MLTKMSRSFKKDQRQTSQPLPSDAGSDSHFYFFSVSGLFLGSGPKALSDSDSMKSPTSPLDHVFSNPDNTLRLSSSLSGESRKSWVCGKVGLGIIDSLREDMQDSQKVFPLSDSKNILFGPQIRTLTRNSQDPTSSFKAHNSLPKNYPVFPEARIGSLPQQTDSDVLFEIGEAALESEHLRMFRACSLDSSIPFAAPSVATKLVGSSPQFVGESSISNTVPLSIGSLSTSEIELSEDYTCVISHGPNPKMTHIYGDCVLECHSNDLSHFVKKGREVRLPISTAYPSSEFLSFCDCCGKTLEEGKDIYIYRGEKAFCSLDCRSREIIIDEELEKSENRTCDDCFGFGSDNGEELFEAGITIAEAPSFSTPPEETNCYGRSP